MPNIPSTIDATRIDPTFPVAGVDNSTQGFRDNFSAIQDALEIANSEISDLLSNAARTDQTSDFNGSEIANALLVNSSQQVYEFTIESISSATSHTISYANGNYQTFFIEKNITLALSSWPATADENKYAVVRIAVRLSDDVVGPYTITFSAGSNTLFKQNGFPNSVILSREFTTSPITTKIFEFSSVDGDNIFARYLGEFSTLSQAGSTGVSELSELSDVLLNSLSNTNILQFNGSKWTNATVSQITAAEITARTAADTTLQNNINSEITARANADTTLQNNINSEITARDTTLQSNINAEATARANADTTLQNNISNLIIDDLANVLITNPENNDMLHYDSNSQKWVNNTIITHIVKIVDDGSLSQEIFEIDNVKLKSNTGIINRNIKFQIGQTYRFDVSHITNTDTKLKFSTTPDTIVDPGNPVGTTITPYTTNVVNNYVTNAPGTAGSYTEIIITDTTPNLYLYSEELNIDSSKIGGEVPILTIDVSAPIVSNIIDMSPDISNYSILATTAAAGTTTVATVSFASQTYIPYPVGSTIKITGVTPPGYNTASSAVIESGTNFVKYASTATGVQTIAGRIELVIPALATTAVEGTGSIATVSFASQTYIPYPVGSTIKITGVTPTGYNTASSTVIDSGTNFVKYASTATGVQTIAGIIDVTTATNLVLLPGQKNQIKTLIFTGQISSSTVINVLTAGWKSTGTGTITFNAIGQACTLHYINNKWFCIGNNGAVFA